MKLKTAYTLISTFTIFTLSAQQSGNQVIGQDYTYNQQTRLQTTERLLLTDSSFVIQAKVLLNVIADSYVAVFGVAESATTLKAANTKIDERIQKFVTALTTGLSLAQSDIYIDMTTSTQIYDYKVSGNYAEQYLSGFEQKKSVTVKFKNIRDLDKMVIIASEHGIHDLAKVDYIISDVSKIYAQLFQTAMETINSKKGMYTGAMNMKLKPASTIFGESFSSYYPSQLYKSYTPNISTDYHDYSSLSRRKDLKHSTTYYYDHISYSGIDRIINPVVTEPAVEFVLMLQVKFDIEKPKK